MTSVLETELGIVIPDLACVQTELDLCILNILEDGFPQLLIMTTNLFHINDKKHISRASDKRGY